MFIGISLQAGSHIPYFNGYRDTLEEGSGDFNRCFPFVFVHTLNYLTFRVWEKCGHKKTSKKPSYVATIFLVWNCYNLNSQLIAGFLFLKLVFMASIN